MTRLGYTLTILFGASLVACSGSIDGGDIPDDQPLAGSTSGSVDNTFDHENDSVSVWTLIDRLQKEGPPTFTSHMHACTKVRYATLGNVLAGLGVDVTAANPPESSAAALYKAAVNSIGSPNYANRIRENIGVTTSGASAEFDIFAAGADEITAALPNLDRCKVGGVGPTMFDTNNQCNAAAITCLIGTPARPEHVDICNKSILYASDHAAPTPVIGKRLAVATLLAAAYTCE
jgi:hypothetical protein